MISQSKRQSILIHYGEIGLKGKNRSHFVVQLVDNIKFKLKTLKLPWKVYTRRDHIHVTVTQPEKVELAISEIKKLSGIAWLAPAITIPAKHISVELIEKEILKLAKKVYKPKQRFGVRAHRTDKSFPLTSSQLEILLGKSIQDNTEWHDVYLDDPDVTFYVDVQYEGVYIFTDKINGIDGLPVGSSDHVLSLLSGGIDSPVASWLMSTRGTTVDCIHFAATNLQLTEAKKYLISDIAKQLSSYTLNTRLFILPYTHFSLALTNKATQYELMLFRRFMLRVAEKLAHQINASAIVTGDNLSQVASQTMSNIVSAYHTINIPILMPLLTYNKNDIMNHARDIGTFDLSNSPYKDCCSLIDLHPKTSSKHSHLIDVESEVLPNYTELVDQTLNEVVVLEYKDGKLIK